MGSLTTRHNWVIGGLLTLGLVLISSGFAGPVSARVVSEPELKVAVSQPVDLTQNLCGPTFRLFDTVTVRDRDGLKGGLMVLRKSKVKHRVCLVVQAWGYLRGPKKGMLAMLCREVCISTHVIHDDDGDYRKFAGPVKLRPRGRCVEAKGVIIDPARSSDDLFTARKTYCGIF